MIKTIKEIKKTAKMVSANFKTNVLTYLAETIANSGCIFEGGQVDIDDIEDLPTEVKMVKTSREPVLVFNISGAQVKLSVTVPKNEVEGEVLAIATKNEEVEEVEENVDEDNEEDIIDEIE